MNIIDRIAKRFGYFKPSPHQRNYHSAVTSRLTSDWLTSSLAADELIRWQLATLRNRSRDLTQNNDYAKNFLRKLRVNVIGPDGIRLQNKARFRNGNLDNRANTMIEEAWTKWSRKASVCGTMSFRDVCGVVLDAAARDGESITRIVRGYDNPFLFAVQVLESDHLDESLNKRLSNGNTIRLGIEVDEWQRPVAYHLKKSHPGEMSPSYYITERLLSSEIVHTYTKDRPTQSRGVPWMHTAILRLRMLGAYEEAALVAARVGASKMGFIIPSDVGAYVGDGQDSYGNTITEVEPGMLETLPPGSSFHSFDPSHPSGELPFFVKSMLRGIASGIGCSYNSLANDLEGVNFSSLRSGLLEERDAWKQVQRWFIDSFIAPVFEAWLQVYLMSDRSGVLSILDYERYNSPRWQTRTWPWVDPLKDLQADVLAIENGLKSRSEIIADMGGDFDELMEQLAYERRVMKEHGIEILKNPVAKQPLNTEEDANGSGTEDDEADQAIPVK